jgi:hypothetical protein
MPSNSEPDTVYLCQVGAHVSCGACCGLHNIADPSPENLEALLTRRTRWFAGVPRTVAGIDAFRDRVTRAEPDQRPFPDFHHCPFLGMIEDDGRRVGCLLHPLAAGNAGLDWRGLSHYGGMACRTYFCPGVRQLPARWLTAVRRSMDHWYLHGLIVTERRLLAEWFTHLEKRLGRSVEADDFSHEPARAALRYAFSALKIEWPSRRPDAPGVCNYFFEDGLYPRPEIEMGEKRISSSRYGAIFRELDSGFPSSSDIKAAEEKIEAMLTALVTAIRRQAYNPTRRLRPRPCKSPCRR